MGNSPSQQTTEGAQGEPEEFDLDAISEGSGDDDMPPKKKKTSAKADGKRELGKLASSATTLKPSHVGTSPLKQLQSTKKELQPLDGYDYPPPPVQDVEMKDPDQTSSNDDSFNVITVALPSPSLQSTRTTAKKTGGSKRKRGSSIVEETPTAKPRKRRREKCSPPTSSDPIEMELRQGSTTEVERPIGLEALERDTELASSEATPPPLPSPRLPLTSDVHQAKESGPDVTETEVTEGDADRAEPRQRRSMATSIAKRTFPSVVKNARRSSRNLQDEAGKPDDAFDRYFGDSDADSAAASPVLRLTSKPTHKRLGAIQESGSALKRSPKTPASVSTRSRSNFDVEGSDDTDDTNAANDTSRLSSREKRRCFECGDFFRSRKLLEEHEKETGHVIDTVRTEVTGRFSEDEIQKLAKYKNDFCQIHDIAGHEFNDMMTDSCRRGASQAWSYDIITKQEFLAQYFDVLPNRNRKSLARFRERNWQNATGSKDWTTEDDDQLIKLVGQIGTKWVEIGQALTRTQDAVHQRWKIYLQYRDTKRGGFWTREESEILEKSVISAKTRSGLYQDSSTDKRIAWAVVSDALNGARTPKQCADHWHFLQESRGLKPRKERASRASKTPLKTPKRTPKKHRAPISSPYVHDSEDELEGDGQSKLVFKGSKDGNEDGNQGDQLGSPELPPIPSKKTPKKITTLGQAFANTQANTSALRRSQRRGPEEPSDQPSPSLPSQAMVRLPATQESIPDEGEEEISETEEAVVTQESSTFRSPAPKASQGGDKSAQNASDSESEDESDNESDDDDDEEEEEVVHPSKHKASPSPELTSSCDELAREVEPAKEEPASDDDLEPLPELPLRNNSKDTAAMQAVCEEDQTSSSGDSDDDEDDASDNDEETASGSDDGSEDSMEKDTRNDFMESIKQTARKAALAKQRKRDGPKVEESESESDTDSDSDAESIAHG